MAHRAGSSARTSPSRADVDAGTPSDRQLLDRLREGELDLSVATEVRDRAAALVSVDPARAHELSTALHAASRGASPVVRATSWRALAETTMFLGRLGRASTCYAAAADEATTARADSLLGQVLVGWIGLLGIRGELRTARPLVRRAQRILTRTGDHEYLGKLFMNLGSASYHEARHEEAYHWYGQAAKLFERTGVTDANWVGLLVNQAVACTNLSRIAEARRLFLRAEVESARLGLSRMTAQVHLNLAHLERLRGDYRAALDRLELAAGVFDRQDAPEMVAAVARERGETYLELCMPVESGELAELAANGFESAGLANDAALARVVVARAALLAGDPLAATPSLDEAEVYFERERISARVAAVRLDRARTLLAQGELEAALVTARRALRTFRSRANRRLEVEARCVVARILLRLDRPAQAARVMEVVRPRISSLSPGLRAVVWGLLGRVARVRGRRADAMRALRRAVECIEAQRVLIPGVEYRARAFELHADTYLELLGVMVEGGRARFAELLALAERSRGRGFHERAGVRPTLRATDVDDRARLQSATHQLETLELSAGSARDETRAGAVRREIRSLERSLATRLRRREGAAGDRPMLDVDRLRRRLGPDASLVEYVCLDSRILAFVIGPGHETVCEMEVCLDEVAGEIDAIGFQLETLATAGAVPPADLRFLRGSTEARLIRLHRALVAPVEDHLSPKGRLVIVPHRLLHRVPFECLHDGDQYLSSRWRVSRSPTADFLLRPRRRNAPGRPRALVAGTLRNGPDYVAKEIDSVAGQLRRLRPRVMRDGTTGDLLDALGDPALVHLSTHGVFRDDNPLFSRLSTGDGALFMADVLETRLRAELVVLSACNTGAVFAGRGDDLSGVAHAFLAAGARRLVASHWRVHDEATFAFMDHFYRAWMGSSGRDVELALDHARCAVRERWDHPFYWGAFGVHGA